MLPRLFLDLFWSTSLIAEHAGAPGAGRSGSPAAGRSGAQPAGFLVGVLSPSEPAEAYVHFVGVAPNARGQGLGEQLYAAFFDLAAADGRRVVRAVTSPANQASIAFHRALGFAVRGPVEGHNGPGTAYVLFERTLS